MSETTDFRGKSVGTDHNDWRQILFLIGSMRSFSAIITSIGDNEGEYFADIYTSGFKQNPTHKNFDLMTFGFQSQYAINDLVQVKILPNNSFGIILEPPYISYIKFSQDWDSTDGNILKGLPCDQYGNSLPSDNPANKSFTINIYWLPRLGQNLTYIYSGFKKNDVAPFLTYSTPQTGAIGAVLFNQAFPMLRNTEEVIKLGPNSSIIADYPRLRDGLSPENSQGNNNG